MRLPFPLHISNYCGIFFILIIIALHGPSMAAEGMNPDTGGPNDYSGSGDWYGTVDDDVYTNNDIVKGSIDMTQGGSDTVLNTRTVESEILFSGHGYNILTNSGSVTTITNMTPSGSTIYNGYNKYINSKDGFAIFLLGSSNQYDKTQGGDNSITNFGVILYIYASGNSGSYSTGGDNTIINYGKLLSGISGSYNSGSHSSGGDNTIINKNIVDYIHGSYNSGEHSSGGNNIIYNYGTAQNTIHGSYNIGNRSSGGTNTIIIASSGTTSSSSYVNGSTNQGDYASGGYNHITNLGTVGANINGSLNGWPDTSGGSNTIINSGTTQMNIVGSWNGGENSSGGSNNITNSGTVGGYANSAHNIYGSRNEGLNSFGGSNTITNTGIVGVNSSYGMSIYGSFNSGDYSSGGENTIINSRSVLEDIVGSDNSGYASSGGGNTITNSGTVGGSIYGSRNTGTGATAGAGNTITNTGTVTGGIFGGDGDDSIVIANGSTVGGDIDGQEGNDLLEFSNYGTIVSFSQYANFEYLEFSGTNTIGCDLNFSGVTTINTGATLSLTGTLTGDLTSGTGGSTVLNNGGTLIGNYIGGSGHDSFENYGTVTGNIYGGAGNDTVTIGAGSTVGGIVDGQTGNDTLTFMDFGTIASMSKYQNFENLAFSGTNTLGGDLNFAGPITVGTNASLTIQGSLTVTSLANQGSCTLNGSMTGYLANSGSLFGTGTLNGTLLNSGSLQPGNSIGTLTVNGNVTFGSGSSYGVELGKDGSSDLLHSTGTVTIQSGSTLDVTLVSSNFERESFDILTADNGLTGEFDSIDFFSETLKLRLMYADDGLQVVAYRTYPYSTFAYTPAQLMVATALDSIVLIADGGMAHMLLVFDTEYNASEIGSAMERLVPEIYFGFDGVACQTARMIANAQQQRAAHQRAKKAHGDVADLAYSIHAPIQGVNAGDAPTTTARWTFWARALGSTYRNQSSASHTGYHSTTGGMILGVDYTPTSWLHMGAHYAYTSSALDWSGAAADYDGMQFGHHLGVYAGLDHQGLYLDASYTLGLFRNASSRPISFGTYNYTAEADFNAQTSLARLGTGYDLRLGHWTLGPLAWIEYLHAHRDRFTENGAEFLSLTTKGDNQDMFSSTQGLHVSHSLDLGTLQLLSRLQLAWRHRYDGSRSELVSNFVDYPNAPMHFSGPSAQKDAFTLQAGLTTRWGEMVTASADYALDCGNQEVSHSFGVSFGLLF